MTNKARERNDAFWSEVLCAYFGTSRIRFSFISLNFHCGRYQVIQFTIDVSLVIHIFSETLSILFA